jgi:hypothetical protein
MPLSAKFRRSRIADATLVAYPTGKDGRKKSVEFEDDQARVEERQPWSDKRGDSLSRPDGDLIGKRT